MNTSLARSERLQPRGHLWSWSAVFNVPGRNKDQGNAVFFLNRRRRRGEICQFCCVSWLQGCRPVRDCRWCSKRRFSANEFDVGWDKTVPMRQFCRSGHGVCVNLGISPVWPSTVASPPSIKEKASLRHQHHKLRNAAFTWTVLFGMKKNASSLTSESHIPHSHTLTHTHLNSTTRETPAHKSYVWIKTQAVIKIYYFTLAVQGEAKLSGRSAEIINGSSLPHMYACGIVMHESVILWRQRNGQTRVH